MYGAYALLLCSISSPSSCSRYTGSNNANYNRVYECSGSTVTEFEVRVGCGPNPGIGDWNVPREQIPSGVQPATNAAGQYCYCQLKSINGGADLPGSPWWVFVYDQGDADHCAIGCSHNCPGLVMTYPGLRSLLFSMAGF
jgi:hypothetical protein